MLHLQMRGGLRAQQNTSFANRRATPRALRLISAVRATPETAAKAAADTAAGNEADAMEAGGSPLQDRFAAQELIDELRDTSKLWQRGEAWTAAQLLAIGLVVLRPIQLTELANIAGALLLLGGLGTMLLGQQFLGRHLSPLPAPRRDSELVQTGVYGYIRHPMYSGLITCSLGLAAVTHDETRLLLAVLLWVVLEQKASFEEKLLVDRYGEAYKEYQARVKKFLPYLY